MLHDKCSSGVSISLAAVDREQVELLISVDGWLSGLDFDGFTDLTFNPRGDQ